MDNLKGMISLADYFSDKSFWFNNDGFHIAGGKPGQDLNTAIPGSFGHNIILNDNSLGIYYDDVMLSNWTEDAINFYNITTSSQSQKIAYFGTEGLVIEQGRINLGTIDLEPDLNNEKYGIYIDEENFIVKIRSLYNSNQLNLSSSGFNLLTPTIEITDEQTNFLMGIRLDKYIFNNNFALNFELQEDLKEFGFYNFNNGEFSEPILTFNNGISYTQTLVASKNINFSNNIQKIGFILRENGHLSLKKN